MDALDLGLAAAADVADALDLGELGAACMVVDAGLAGLGLGRGLATAEAGAVVTGVFGDGGA